MPTVAAKVASQYLVIQALTQLCACRTAGCCPCEYAQREGRNQCCALQAWITDSTHVGARNSQRLGSPAHATGDGAQQGANAPCCLIAKVSYRRAMRTTCRSSRGVVSLVRDRVASLKVVGVAWQLG